MYIELITCSIYSIIYLCMAKELPAPLSLLVFGLLVVFIITAFIIFFAGYVLFNMNTDNDILWMLFSGLGFNYDVDNLMDYTISNLIRLVIITLTVGTMAIVIYHTV